MSDKKISYLSRDFSSVRKELEKFSKQYYPELSDDWNDSSVGSWLMDLAASVGDDLAYHTDRMYQESTLDSANMRSSVVSQARSNGLKIPSLNFFFNKEPARYANRLKVTPANMDVSKNSCIYFPSFI